MPTSAPRNCTKAGCNGLIRNGVCSQCGSLKASNWRKESPSTEGTAHQRGYGHTWRKLRLTVLADNPLCVECARFGRVTVATDVDHIVPKHLGGPDDYDNLQPLCRECHRSKTSRDSRFKDDSFKPSTIPCTVVAGAPGSGKTTYVQQHMIAGDLVIDLDMLYVALSGGLDYYDKPRGLLPFVCEARDAVLKRLGRESNVRHAWIVTGESNRGALSVLCAQLEAELVVIDTGPNECLRHIANDARRSTHLDQWKRLVYDWWQEYKASESIAEYADG